MTKGRILVVDHYPAFIDLIQDLLADEDYTCIGMFDNHPNMIYKRIVQDNPDLVLLDIIAQPYDAAMSVLALIRLNPITRNIPVIVSSSDVRYLKEKEPGLQLLGCCILEKPFDLTQLMTTIEQALAG